MTPLIKICGLKAPEAIRAAEGADYLGFVFFPPSPRYVTPEEAAKLKAFVTDAETVAVTVDAGDTLLEDIFRHFAPDLLQMHGDEPVSRIREVKNKFHVPVIKAISVATATDLEKAAEYEKDADFLLFDTKTSDGERGGTGKAFDWNILAEKKFSRPFFVSGGIHAGNVEKALLISGAMMVDVSSGVESSRGVKDPAMVAGFIEKAKSLSL